MSKSRKFVFAIVVVSRLFVAANTWADCHSGGSVIGSNSVSAKNIVLSSPESTLGLPPGSRILSVSAMKPTVMPSSAVTGPTKATSPKPAVAKPTIPPTSIDAQNTGSRDTDRESAKSKKQAPAEETKFTLVRHEVPQLQTGDEIEVSVRFALDQPGHAIMTTGDFESDLKITRWSPDAISLLMPTIGILRPTHVTISLYRPDGFLVKTFDAQLIRKNSITVVKRTTLAMATRVQD